MSTDDSSHELPSDKDGASSPAGRDGLWVAIDVGGTFADVVLVDGDTLVDLHKALNVPDRVAEVVDASIGELLAAHGLHAGELERIVYSTTVATNTVIERTGANVGMATTSGFRDVTEVRRDQPYDLYEPFASYPTPIVPRHRRFVIKERTLFDGTIQRHPDLSEVESVAAEMAAEGVDSIAVCLLHSYANSRNERRVAKMLSARLSDTPISLSSDVQPEVGEYERFSTTVVNAYVRPKLSTHLRHLDDLLRRSGFRGEFVVVTSGGGTMTMGTATALPVRLLESGPAAATVGVATMARSVLRTASDRVVVFDMGGTTAKTTLIEHGEPTITTEYEIARVARLRRGSGLMVRIPTCDVVEVGAGGGSIARVSAGGLLTVGPSSAGAYPGPACYGHGGSEPTVTDADLLLGYIGANSFLGGTMPLEVDAANRAVGALAKSLDCTAIAAAAGIYRVVNARMSQATAVHAAERGLNLSRTTVVAIGGAGPVHAWSVAQQLGADSVVIPRCAGVFSAVGCSVVPLSFDHVVTRRIEIDQLTNDSVRRTLEDLRRRCLLEFRNASHTFRFTYFVDLRYVGQRSSLTVPLAGLVPDSGLPHALAADFSSAYKTMYGRTVPGVPIEAVSWRVRATEAKAYDWPSMSAQDAATTYTGSRSVHFGEYGFVTTDVFTGTGLEAAIEGPAIIEEAHTSIVVPPGAQAMPLDEVGVVVTVPKVRV